MQNNSIEDLQPKRQTREYKSFGRVAEWMVVHDGKTLEEVYESPEIAKSVAITTLQQWSAKYGWQEKRRKYEKKPITVPKMSYDLLYSELLRLNQRQMNGEDLSKTDVDKLEKLVKVFRQTGLPFGEQVATVMKVFFRYVESHTIKDSDTQAAFLSLIKDFLGDVEGGFIHPE